MEPIHFALVLSTSPKQHDEFITAIRNQYGSDVGGFTIIKPADIPTCPRGASYLVDAYIPEFMALNKTRERCIKRQCDSLILYTLETKNNKWNFSATNMFTFVLSNQPDVYPTMHDFVESLK